MLRIVLVSAVALVLAGCNQTFSEMSPEQQQEFVQKRGAECQIIGYKPGTRAYTDCIQTAVRENDRDTSRQRAAAASSGPTTCNRIGNTVTCF